MILVEIGRRVDLVVGRPHDLGFHWRPICWLANRRLIPAPLATPEIGIAALEPAAPPASGQQGDAALAVPDQESESAMAEVDVLPGDGSQFLSDGEDGVSGGEDVAPETAATEESPASATPGEPLTEKDGQEEPLVLPQATVVGAFDSSDALEFAAGSSSPQTVPAIEDESGFALPLWQLQIAFAALAVLMAGAWILLQRRLTS